jgi:hypothetical protein
MQTAVGLLGAVASGRIGGVSAAAQVGTDPVGRAMVPSSLDQQSSGVLLPVLVIEPWLREAPEEDSVGTSPR